MPRLGAHLSIAGGVWRAVERARALGCECLQIFVKPPRNWLLPELADRAVHRFRAAADEAGLRPVFAHASYLPNPASPEPALWQRSLACLLAEWDRTERLGLAGLVLHPGSHRGAGREAGLARLVEALRRLARARPRRTTPILLETTAGAGHGLGDRLEDLARTIEACPDGPPLGLALDTCHLWAAGYDLRSAEGLEALLAKVRRTAGLERVALVHANDARARRGSHLDRHEHIGRGRIGREGFRRLLTHPALRDLPFILETPKRDARGRAMDPVNLRALRRLAGR